MDISLTGLPRWEPSVPAAAFEQNRAHALPEELHPFALTNFEWRNIQVPSAQPQGEVVGSHAQRPLPWTFAGPLLRQPVLDCTEASEPQNDAHLSESGGVPTPQRSQTSSSEHGSMNGGMQMTLPATGLRTMEDQILLDGKRSGLTYKEIRKRMPSKIAESTLRGRYRSLTKARKDRVRKPVWTKNDVSFGNPLPLLGSTNTR